MKILVLNFQGLEAEALFGNVYLGTLHRLMDLGCFGRLQGEPTGWDILARQEHDTLTIVAFLEQADKKCARFENFPSLRTRLQTPDWDYCQLTDTGLKVTPEATKDEYLRLDQELEDMLQYLSDDTVLAIIGEGCFVLVSGNSPLQGEYEHGSVEDIAPTVLELAGYPLPAETVGKSWVAGMQLENTSGLTDEEEAILRERLSGLGYI
jgi:hypothetical protein